MPKNPDFAEAIGQWKSEPSPDLKASLNALKKHDSENVNEIYKLLYDEEKIQSAEEKTIIINQFFADLFDANSFNWSINYNGKRYPKLIKLLNKYLEQTNFPIELWQTKFKSGMYGKYALVIIKELIGTDSKGEKITRPNIIPVRVVYKNTINNKLFEVEVEFEGYSFSNGKNNFALLRKYSLLDNKITLDSSLIDVKTKKTILESELNDQIKKNVVLGIQEFQWDFIPVSILSNNYDEIPKINIVISRMNMINNFDETLAILPAWEKGAVLTNSTVVTSQNQELQNLDFMKMLLLKGFVQFKPIDLDGQLMNLADNVVIFKPASIMQTTKATRDLIWMEIKEDLGLPALNDVKSAQKNSIEVMAKQFLTSPIMEREKIFMKQFLSDFAKKFLIILSECNIPDDFPLIEDWNQVEIKVDFDLTTNKNINETAKIIQTKEIEKPTQIEEEIKDDEKPKQKRGFFRRIFRRN